MLETPMYLFWVTEKVRTISRKDLKAWEILRDYTPSSQTGGDDIVRSPWRHGVLKNCSGVKTSIMMKNHQMKFRPARMA